MNFKQGAVAAIAVLAVAVAGWFAFPLLQGAPKQAAAPFFSDWAAIVVAGDWRAQNGQPSDVFDNGRREIGKKLVSIGFQSQNLRQFSVQSQKYTDVQPSTGDAIADGLETVARQALGGCMLYFTSHGSEEGIVIGNRMVDPAAIADLVNGACGDRPAVIIMSACYAGQFIGELKAPNRIVFTAARHDRSSFGCGEQDEYTFFDACVLQQFDKAGNFSELATRVDDCVSEREQAMKVDPPSEPQFYIGPQVAYTLNWK
jgi:hypothetical protein